MTRTSTGEVPMRTLPPELAAARAAMKHAINQVGPLSQTERAVLVGLADGMNSAGDLRPNAVVLAQVAGIGKQTVKQVVKTLHDRGLLRLLSAADAYGNPVGYSVETVYAFGGPLRMPGSSSPEERL